MGTRPRSRRHKWAAGMASIRLPGMISGLRMEKGTAALGGLETWSILEGMPAWAGPGQLSELQRIEKAIPSSAEQAEGRQAVNKKHADRVLPGAALVYILLSEKKNHIPRKEKRV